MLAQDTKDQHTQGHAKMAKKQRSLLLDEDLARLIDAFQGTTGATYTRVITAAVVQYFFDHPHPDAKWMQVAVALERGDLTVGDIRVKLAESTIRNCKDVLDEFTRTAESPDTDPAVERFRRELHEHEQSLEEWRAKIAKAGDPMEALLAHVSHGSLAQYYRLMDELASRPKDTSAKGSDN